MQPDDSKQLCPKCDAPLRAGLDACATCGLARARMASFSAERESSVTEAVRAAWDRVLEAWTDEARHDALFRLVAERGEYTWVAARYREQARSRDGDPIAANQMDRIRRAIEATLLVSATARGKPQASPYKNLVAMFALLLVLLGIGAFYIFMKSKTTAEDATPAPRSVAPVSPRPQVR